MRGATEARVGAVIVLALALIVVGYFFLRGLGLGADIYYVRLTGPANIATGNDVRLQGVKIGQVQDVTLDPVTQKPLLTLAIRRNNPPYALLQSYEYSVQSGSLLGENYVDIRGRYEETAERYRPNDVIVGRAPGAGLAGISDETAVLLKDFRTTLGKFNVTIDRINKGVLSYQNQMKLAQALTGVTRLMESAGQGFGRQGIKLTLGDPRSQRAFNATLENTSVAAREAGNAAREAGSAAREAGLAVRDINRNINLNVNRLGGELQGAVGENRGQLRALFTNLNRTASNLAGVAQSVEFVLREGGFQENTKRATGALARAAENVEATTAGFKAVVGDPALQQDLRNTVSSLRQAAQSVSGAANSVNALLGDPNNQNQLKSTFSALSASATTLQETMANLRDASSGINKVINDPQVQSSLKGTAADLQGTLAATRAAAERINALLGGRRARRTSTSADNNGAGAGGGTTDGAGSGTGGGTGAGSGNDGGNNGKANKTRGSSAPPGGVDFTFRYLDNRGRPGSNDRVRGHYFGDLTFNAEFFGGPLRAGLANIGEGTDLTLQTGTFLGRNTAVRYGLYRSKLGVGAEYRAGRFSLEGNLWDPNDGSANAYLGFQVTPNVEIIAGREHIGDVRSNAIGVRLRP